MKAGLEALTGNAQIIGAQNEQREYFAVFRENGAGGCVLALVAGGCGAGDAGRSAAMTASRVLRENFYRDVHHREGVEQYFERSISEMRRRLRNISWSIPPALVAAILENGAVRYIALGSCKLLIGRGDRLLISMKNLSTPKVCKAPLRKGDCLMLCSRGFYESLTEMEMLHVLSQGAHPYDKCQTMMDRIQKKQYKDQENATVVLLENIYRR